MRASLLALAVAASLGAPADLGPAPTPPVLVPGAGYDAVLEANQLSALRGADLAAAQARPEYGSFAQVGATGAEGTVAATLAPILHWVTPTVTNEIMQADLRVQVCSLAAAAVGIAGGIDRVEIWADGAVVTLPGTPVAIAIPLSAAQGGGVRHVPGYEAVIPFAAVADGSRLKLYAKAFPTLGALSPRVIGPMFVARKAQFDHTVTIDRTAAEANNFAQGSATPSRFQTVKAAIAAAVAWTGFPGSHVAINLSASEAQGVDVKTVTPANALAASNASTGRIYVNGNGAPIANSNAPGTYVGWRPYFNGLVFQRFVIDTAWITSVLYPSGENTYFLFEDCEFYSSRGLTEYNPVNLTFRPTLWNQLLAAFRRVHVHDLDGGGGCPVAVRIGCKMERHSGDHVDYLPGRPTTVIASDCDRIASPQVDDPQPCVQLTYTGAGVATYGIGGIQATYSPSASARTLTLSVDGAAVPNGTFVASSTAGPGLYFSMADVVAGINALPDWTAQAINATTTLGLRFAYLAVPVSFEVGGVHQDYSSNHKGTGTASGVPIGAGLRTGADQHTDVMQFIGTPGFDNILFMSSYAIQCQAQLMYIGTGATAAAANVAVVLSAFNNDMDVYNANGTGQVVGNLQHLLVAACSQPSVILSVHPLSLDETSRIENLYVNDLAVSGTADTCKAKIRRIVTAKRTNALPTGLAGLDTASIVNLGVGGTSATPYKFNTADFPDLASGLQVNGTPSTFTAHTSFTPAAGGLIDQHLVPPSFPIDIEGRPTAALDRVGPVALAA